MLTAPRGKPERTVKEFEYRPGAVHRDENVHVDVDRHHRLNGPKLATVVVFPAASV
jgi:hypothetical protein